MDQNMDPFIQSMEGTLLQTDPKSAHHSKASMYKNSGQVLAQLH